MKNKELKIRISERRLNKVRLYAAWADKTMTQVMEECIDRLPSPEVGNNFKLSEAEASTIPLPHQPGG